MNQSKIVLPRFFIGAQAYSLIVSPRPAGEQESIAWGPKKKVAGAENYCDGFANTEAMAAAGSDLAKWARALRIDDHADWYLPSRLESLILFGELPEEFEKDWYWTSTQYAPNDAYAWCQYFSNGTQDYGREDISLRARAVRRLPIQ